MKKLYLGLLLGFIVVQSHLEAKVIIWDLGNVLLETNMRGIRKHIGFMNLLSYMFFDWRSPFIKPLVFDVLDMMPCPELPDDAKAPDHDGNSLPPILCHWQAGTIKGTEILEQSKAHIENLYTEGYFVSGREKKLVEQSFQTMFDPFLLGTNFRQIRAGVRLLKECAHEINEDGSKRNTLIALSNWDPDSFDIIYEQHSEIFNHFDHLVISGKTGFIKPCKKAYVNLITHYHLDPEDCIFIDDQIVNLEVAEQFGIDTFHLSQGNYRELRKVLIECGALGCNTF